MTISQSSPNNQTFISGALGGLVGAVANAIVFFIATALFSINLQITQPPEMTTLGLLPLPAVILASFVPDIFAALLYLLLQRFTAQAGRIFLGIAVVVLVFSFFPLVGMPLMTDSVKVVLAVMHIVAAGAIMGAFALRQR